jgi:hypothetical protein
MNHTVGRQFASQLKLLIGFEGQYYGEGLAAGISQNKVWPPDHETPQLKAHPK